MNKELQNIIKDDVDRYYNDRSYPMFYKWRNINI